MSDRIISSFEDAYEGVLAQHEAVAFMAPDVGGARIIVEASADLLHADDLNDLSRALPATFEDTAIEVVSRVDDESAGDRFDTLRPGISVGGRVATTGTIGAFVRHDGQPAILSNWHILRRARIRRRGRYDIFQPGRLFQGTRVRNIVGRVTDWSKGLDCAVATLNDSRGFDTATRLSAFVLTEVRDPKEGDILEKVGARTGLTRGRVVDVKGVNVRIHPLKGKEDEEVSDGGDSGALWYFPDTGCGAVLHTYGEKRNGHEEYAAGRLLSAVQRRLGFTLLD